MAPRGRSDAMRSWRKRHRRVLTQLTINEKVALAVHKRKTETKEELAKVVDAWVSVALVVSFSSLIPIVWDWTKNNPDKGPHAFPFPSFLGSNLVNIAPPAPAHATTDAPIPGLAPVQSSPSSVSGVLGGASSLVELDAIKVITQHTLFTSISIVFSFRCVSDV